MKRHSIRPRPELRAVLLDVGGTLWPDRWPVTIDGHYRRRLCGALPGLPAPTSERLFDDLRERASLASESTRQDTRSMVVQALLDHSLDADPGVVDAVLDAMDLPAEGIIEPFGGARELLATIKDLELTCAIVSNTTWRGSGGYRRDLNSLGVGDCVDVVTSSLDAGCRKPDEHIFRATLEACRVDPALCVMVGNSERNDILPALALGMRTIRVAIEEPPPSESRAQAVATSLHEVGALVRQWCDE